MRPVTIVAVGVGLYANELRRQADERRAAEKAADVDRVARQLEIAQENVAALCHSVNENVKPDEHAKEGSFEWIKLHCDSARSTRDYWDKRLKEVESER
jgi:hypothetical protein